MFYLLNYLAFQIKLISMNELNFIICSALVKIDFDLESILQWKYYYLN